ncbi:hypothetical protein [Arthrobacter sp. SAFR-014]|uniref:hypothetical protein n=1 Tax=unclassified Arthrobacter TaxID=235627 RepID=UPI003F7BFD42
MANDVRKKQPGDLLMGLGVVVLLLALFGAITATTAGNPAVVAVVGVILIGIGFWRRRSALQR